MEWAEREVEIAKSKNGEDSGYYNGCCESALKAFAALCDDGHSGCSIKITQRILNRLMDGKPLTPIEDIPEVWNQVLSGENGVTSYQCKRMSSLFKDVYQNGHVEYVDTGRYYCVNIGDESATYTMSLATTILNEVSPITMPYMPADKKIKVVCADLLTDPKNGDFDTEAILYAILPDGTKYSINRFFKAQELITNPGKYKGWTEIDINEFKERYSMECSLTGNSKNILVEYINELETGESSILFADGEAIFASRGLHATLFECEELNMSKGGLTSKIVKKCDGETSATVNKDSIVSTVVDKHGNSSTITQGIYPTLEIKVEAPTINMGLTAETIQNKIIEINERRPRRGF